MLNFLFNRNGVLENKLILAKQRLTSSNFEEAFQICQEIHQRSKIFKPDVVLYIGTCALFGLGHVHQAEQWMREHDKKAKHNTNYLYLTAFLSLHHNQPAQALLDWTSILQLDPSQTFADRLIARIKNSEKEVLDEISIPNYFKRYIPLEILADDLASSSKSDTYSSASSYITSNKFKFIASLFFSQYSKKTRNILFLGIGALILFLLLLFSMDFSLLAPISSFFKNRNLSITLAQAPSDGAILAPEQYTGELPPIIYGSRREAIAKYISARNKIIKGEINQARLILGHLELSNVNFEFKERVLLLRASIPLLAWDDFKDSLKLSDIQQSPYLYRDAQIFWKGRLRAIIPGAKKILLELEAPREVFASTAKRAGGQDNTRAESKSPLLLVEYLVSGSEKADVMEELETKKYVQVFGSFQNINKKQQIINIQAQKLFFVSE